MAKNILVVDDNPNICNMLKEYLSAEGFHVSTATNGQKALHIARDEKPDCIVLDIMMPEIGGLEFLQIYTAEANTPILVLTAKMEENDKVLGLELGADDYVTKPFSIRELTARIHALLRRAEKPQETDVLRVSDIVLDKNAHIVKVLGQEKNLTPSEFKLLETLMSSPGRAYSREELLENLYASTPSAGYQRSIDVHIHNLRDKIEPLPDNPGYIETVYGTGYRIIPKSSD